MKKYEILIEVEGIVEKLNGCYSEQIVGFSIEYGYVDVLISRCA